MQTTTADTSPAPGRTSPAVRTLRSLALLMGVACVAIGIYHLTLGLRSVPGGGDLATNDSRERFYNAIFLGFGLAWWWAARQRVLPLPLLQVLTLVFLLGGLGRVLSILDYGWPHWFQNPWSAIELILPLGLLLLIRHLRRVGYAPDQPGLTSRGPGPAAP